MALLKSSFSITEFGCFVMDSRLPAGQRLQSNRTHCRGRNQLVYELLSKNTLKVNRYLPPPL